MSNRLFAMTPRSKRYPVAGLAAGAIGGFISGFVKLGWEVPFPPRTADRIPEPQVLVSLFTHHSTPAVVSLIIHFAFSTVIGAIYGVLVEVFPIVALGLGTVFGIVIFVGAHEIVMPIIGLTPAAWNLPRAEQLSEFFGHAIWGLAIEVFRLVFRARFSGTVNDPTRSMHLANRE